MLDYRVGWQSTFLDAGTRAPAAVHAAGAGAGAVRVSTLPDVAALQALRLSADAPRQPPAAPWIHLYALTLALLVRAAAAGAGAVGRRARALAAAPRPLPLVEPYFQRLLR